jgi:hypothetical protein
MRIDALGEKPGRTMAETAGNIEVRMKGIMGVVERCMQ